MCNLDLTFVIEYDLIIGKMSDQKYLTEIPSSLKQLARLVVRGFYTIEDSLIIDMLVRNPCKLLIKYIITPKLSKKLLNLYFKFVYFIL